MNKKKEADSSNWVGIFDMFAIPVSLFPTTRKKYSGSSGGLFLTFTLFVFVLSFVGSKCLAMIESSNDKYDSQSMAYDLSDETNQFHLKDFKFLPSISIDLLDNGDLSRTTKWGINDHAAMIEKLDASGRLKELLTNTQVFNVANYFVTLPSEVAMKLWTVLGDGDCVDNVVALHRTTTTSGIQVSKHLTKILGG